MPMDHLKWGIASFDLIVELTESEIERRKIDFPAKSGSGPRYIRNCNNVEVLGLSPTALEERSGTGIGVAPMLQQWLSDEGLVQFRTTLARTLNEVLEKVVGLCEGVSGERGYTVTEEACSAVCPGEIILEGNQGWLTSVRFRSRVDLVNARQGVCELMVLRLRAADNIISVESRHWGGPR